MKSAHFAQDLLASIVVFLVALPLCMGIAIASGVDPAMGLLSGIVGGLVVGFFAGAPLQVSGPAAGLAVIVFEAIQSHGLQTFAIIVLIAGLVQILAGVFKVGQWFRAVAPAVIYAMLAGIGVLIFLSQTHVMLDIKPQSSSLDNLMAIPGSLAKVFVLDGGASHPFAGILAAMTLSILIVWNLVRSKLPSKIAIVPAPLLAIVLATVVAAVFQFPVTYVEVPESLGALIRLPAAGDFAVLSQPAVWGSALAMAVVASAESLLCAAALDKMKKGEPADLNRELVAQGIGNSVLGVLGGLPLTGVIVRSTANLDAGGKTRLSAILHGAWLLLMVAMFPWLLQKIPVSALAAVLVYIGYKLVNVQAIKELFAQGRGELTVYAVTLTSIVFLNLLTGLMIGFVLSIIHLAWKSSRLKVAVQDEKDVSNVYLQGSATVFVLHQLVDGLNNIPDTKETRVHLETLSYIDHACLMYMQEWAENKESKGSSVVVEWDALERRSKRLQILDKVS